MIYWGHGINLRTPDAKIKNLIFRFIHTISDAIILYSTEQLKYVSTRNQKKTFIAKNTLSFEDTDLKTLHPKEQVKEKYGVTIPLFIMTSDKNHEDTVAFFVDNNYF